VLKGLFTQKWKFCHHWLTHMSFQTCMTLFLLQKKQHTKKKNTKPRYFEEWLTKNKKKIKNTRVSKRWQNYPFFGGDYPVKSLRFKIDGLPIGQFKWNISDGNSRSYFFFFSLKENLLLQPCRFAWNDYAFPRSKREIFRHHHKEFWHFTENSFLLNSLLY